MKVEPRIAGLIAFFFGLGWWTYRWRDFEETMIAIGASTAPKDMPFLKIEPRWLVLSPALVAFAIAVFFAILSKNHEDR